MSYGMGVTQVEYSANNLNLNQGSNTVLATFFFPRKCTILRYGVVAEAAEGLLSPCILNMATVIAGGATATEVSNSNLVVGSARARGVPVYKDLASRVEVAAGQLVQIRADTAAGGTSTGRVWIEYVPEAFNGSNIPTAFVASA